MAEAEGSTAVAAVAGEVVAAAAAAAAAGVVTHTVSRRITTIRISLHINRVTADITIISMEDSVAVALTRDMVAVEDTDSTRGTMEGEAVAVEAGEIHINKAVR